MAIITHGIRHDDPHLWEKSKVLDGSEAMHHPYVVMVELTTPALVEGGLSSVDGLNTSVAQVRGIVDLLEYPDHAIVLWQWPGKDRSDFFRFTIAEFKIKLAERRAAKRSAAVQGELPDAGH